MALKEICAWCGAYLGETECSNSGVSHGICEACQQRLFTTHFLRKEHISAGMTLEKDGKVFLLRQNGRTVASFSSPLSWESLLQQADQYLNL